MQSDEINFLENVVGAISKTNNDTLVFNNTKDTNVLLSILNKVKPYPNSSEFPDYLSDDAIIEHFSFTPSNDNRKGSSFMKE